MADETTNQAQGDLPAQGSAAQAAPVAKPAKPPAPVPEPVVSDEPVTAKAKLRAFEDDVFGKDAGRINGEVERGVGSPFAKMTGEQRRQHQALERLVVAEKKLADASAELSAAEVAHDAATREVEASEAVVDDGSK
jgi:hypothetical protein